MLLFGRIYIARRPWYCKDFRNIFLPNKGEDQTNALPSERRASGTVPYGKSGSGYCIMFIKRLDEGLTLQVLIQNPLFYPGGICKLVAKKELRGPGPLAVLA